MRNPVTLTDKDRSIGVERLRYEAHLAYLDGRNARAKELNRKADAIYREALEIVRNNMSLSDLDSLQESFP